MLKNIFKNKQQGSALILAGIITIILVIIVASVMHYTMNQNFLNKKTSDSIKALYLAEAGLNYAGNLLSVNSIDYIKTNILTKTDGSQKYTNINYNPFENQKNLNSDLNKYYPNYSVTVKISAESSELNDNVYVPFHVKVTAIVNKSKKIISASLIKNAPSKVFDYVYFLNNWGYAFGGHITMYGDCRSNGHYGIKGKPTINGNIYASGNIHYGTNYDEELSSSDVNGWASYEDDQGNHPFWHPHSQKVKMPNLYKLSFYENLAKNEGGKIWIAPPGVESTPENTVVDTVYGDDEGEKENLILTTKPGEVIHIEGPVVIKGNLIIKGKITGKGCIYVGNNLYVAGNLEYNDPADYKNIPNDPLDKDYDKKLEQWVKDNKDKDLVGFAVQENIIVGDWTKSNWYPNQYKNMWQNWGEEDAGKDGIPNTNDEFEDDGIWQKEYEDVDEDGIKDDNYNYGDVFLKPTDYAPGAPSQNLSIDDFDNVPPNANDFKDLYTQKDVVKMDGIYYTNHMLAASVKNAEMRGTIVSKDEAIVYANKIEQRYDWRIHSKFRDLEDFDLKIPLPTDFTAKVTYWKIEE